MPTISSLSLAGANLPRSASADAARILVARGLRAFGDGFVALLVPIYLVELGFSAWAIGTIVTSTLIGTAVLTLWIGMVANRHSLRLPADRGCPADGGHRRRLRN
jgi:MFS family permease